MTLGLALVSWIVLIAPYVHDPTLSLLPKLVSIAYPLGDIVLLAAAIRLTVDAGKRRPAFYLLALSIVTLLVTDFVYGVMTLNSALPPSDHSSTWAGSASICSGAPPRCIRRCASSSSRS